MGEVTGSQLKKSKYQNGSFILTKRYVERERLYVLV